VDWAIGDQTHSGAHTLNYFWPEYLLKHKE